MLTKLSARNFKQFNEIEIELGERVLLVGPNNSGKTSALQALALWSAGVRRWTEKRGAGEAPKKRPGVTINRRDLIAIPVPAANLLWRNLRVREGLKENGQQRTRNVLIDIAVEGIDNGAVWSAHLEFDYANEESFYCRAALAAEGIRAPMPAAASSLKIAYLPPMSGLASNELRLDQGAIDVRIGEGRTAEVLRNLCWSVREKDEEVWRGIAKHIEQLFGVEINDPIYIRERGEITMSFRTREGVELDLAACGRGQQQTLLLLAHMAANPGSLLLLDEPDAHLEILRQRQIYEVLTKTATTTQSQIIAASHSEVLLNEAADRDMVIAFVGRPHRIDDRGGAQVLKSLKEIGFEHYIQAEETGWVLYLEGSTDLAILRAFAARLNHPAAAALERPFAHYVGNQPGKARGHFFGLREARSDLRGIAVFDRIEGDLHGNIELEQIMWKRREIECYLSQQSTLLAFAESRGRAQQGDLFAESWRDAMEKAIDKVKQALAVLSKDPWGPDIKASEEFLDPVFKAFYQSLGLPDMMRKTDFHILAEFVSSDDIADEVIQVLGRIHAVAESARQPDIEGWVSEGNEQ